MPAGPELSVVLASIDRTRLTGHDLVVLLEARGRQVSFDQAELYAGMAEVAHATEPDTVDRSLGLPARHRVAASLFQLGAGHLHPVRIRRLAGGPA